MVTKRGRNEASFLFVEGSHWRMLLGVQGSLKYSHCQIFVDGLSILLRTSGEESEPQKTNIIATIPVT